MITQHDIITAAQNIFKRGRGIPDRALMHPHREWVRGLAICALIVVSGGTYQMVQFYTLTTSVPENEVTSDVPKLEVEALNALAETYKRRADSFHALLASAPKQPVATSTATTSREAVEVLRAE